MDISETTAPRSDQQNFDDYLAGDRVVTIEKVTKGSTEQPIEVHLIEYPGRPYKPSKTQRRVFLSAWGKETGDYAGRQMRLTGDPSVRFGGVAVGGIKIAALSHIDKTLKLSLTETKGKRAVQVIEPLVVAAQAPTTPALDAETERVIADLTAEWKDATDERKAEIQAEVAKLRAGAES